MKIPVFSQKSGYFRTIEKGVRTNYHLNFLYLQEKKLLKKGKPGIR